MADDNRSVSNIFRVHDDPAYEHLLPYTQPGMRFNLFTWSWVSYDRYASEPYNDYLDVIADSSVSDKLFLGYRRLSDYTNYGAFGGGFYVKPDNPTITGYLKPTTRVYLQGVYEKRGISPAADHRLTAAGDAVATTLSALQDAWSRSWGMPTIPAGAVTYEDPDDPGDIDSAYGGSASTTAYGVVTERFSLGAFTANLGSATGDTTRLAYHPNWRVEVDGELLYEVFSNLAMASGLPDYGAYEIVTDPQPWNNNPEEYVDGVVEYPPQNLRSFPGSAGVPLTIEAGIVGRTSSEPGDGDIDEADVHQGDTVYRVDYLPLFPISEAEWLAAGGTGSGGDPADKVRFLGFAYLKLSDLSGIDPSLVHVPTSYRTEGQLGPFSERILSMQQLYGGSTSSLRLGVDLDPEADPPEEPTQLPPIELTPRGPGDVTPYKVDVLANFTSSSHRFYGIELVSEERIAVFEGDPPLDVPGPYQGPPGWMHALKRYRSGIAGAVVPKHPLMPPGMGGAVAYDPYGNPRSLLRHGDYLLILDPQEEDQVPRTPTWVYWNAEPDGAALDVASNAMYDSLRALNPVSPTAWSPVEEFHYNRNRVEPRIVVYVGGGLLEDGSPALMEDVSPYLTEINGGEITLLGRGGIFEMDSSDDNFPRVVRIEMRGQPVYTGHLVSARSKAYANGNELTLSTVRFSEFHDIDLADVDAQTIAFPELEEHYLRGLLDRTGFNQRLVALTSTPPLQLRDTDFWTAAPPDGPGFVPEEVQDLYRTGATEGSSTEEVRQLLHANMLELHDLPTGDLLITPILPHYDETIDEIFANRAIKYGTAPNGAYLRDARLDLQGVSLDLDERFAEVEVEGTSNEVQVTLAPGAARFWQATTQGAYQEFFQKSLPGGLTGPVDSTGVWPSSDAPPGSAEYEGLSDSMQPWTFRSHDGDGLVLEMHPLPWYDVVKLSKGNDTIEAKKISGGNRWIAFKRLLKSPLKDIGKLVDDPQNPGTQVREGELFARTFGDTVTAEDGYPNGLLPTHEAVWGLEAGATGTFWSSATFEFKATVPRTDGEDSTLKINPLIGRYAELFAPTWFPGSVITEKLESLRLSKPRKARRTQNPYIAPIGQQFSVQKHGDPALYDADSAHAASQLASWLTIQEFLKSRTVQVRYAGAQPWWPGQFIAVARRPAGGDGGNVSVFDILLILETPEADAQVGAEAWTTTKAAFVCSYAPVSGTAEYDMQAAWSPSYQVDES